MKRILEAFKGSWEMDSYFCSPHPRIFRNVEIGRDVEDLLG